MTKRVESLPLDGIYEVKGDNLTGLLQHTLQQPNFINFWILQWPCLPSSRRFPAVSEKPEQRECLLRIY